MAKKVKQVEGLAAQEEALAELKATMEEAKEMAERYFTEFDDKNEPKKAADDLPFDWS